MKYQAEKNIDYEGATLKFVVKFTLNDAGHNGVCTFSITGDAVCVKGKREVCKKGDLIFGGSCHEEIARYFPELIPFTPLHLCDEFGQPFHPVDNFIYHINQRTSKRKLCDWYRVTEEDLEVLEKFTDEKMFFQYQLFQLGIIDRWKQEAEQAIEWLEEKTGEKFKHTENPQHTLVIGEWYDQVERCVEEGYFTPEFMQAFRGTKHQLWVEKKTQEIKAQHERDIEFANRKKELALWCVNNVPTENYSFNGYRIVGREQPTYELRINSCKWDKQMIKEEYQAFIENKEVPKDLKINFIPPKSC